MIGGALNWDQFATVDLPGRQTLYLSISDVAFAFNIAFIGISFKMSLLINDFQIVE